MTLMSYSMGSFRFLVALIFAGAGFLVEFLGESSHSFTFWGFLRTRELDLIINLIRNTCNSEGDKSPGIQCRNKLNVQHK